MVIDLKRGTHEQVHPGAWKVNQWGQENAITIISNDDCTPYSHYVPALSSSVERLPDVFEASSSSEDEDDTRSTTNSVASSSTLSSQTSYSGYESSDTTSQAGDYENSSIYTPSSDNSKGDESHASYQKHLLSGLATSTDDNYTSVAASQGSGTTIHPPSVTYRNLEENNRRTRGSEPNGSSQPWHVQPHHLVQAPIGPRNCRRRSASHDNGNAQPPKLKRDTECTDNFVSQLISFTCRLITAIWPLSAVPPMMSTCFNGAGVLPLETFVYETLRRSKTSYSTLQIALYYIVLLKPKLPDLDFTKEQPESHASSTEKGTHGCRAMQCGRRMFLSALMLASKYIQDRNYSTRAWSKISGLRIPEINENERQYLGLIDYNLHLKQETFDNWSRLVLTLSKLSRHQAGGLPSEQGKWTTSNSSPRVAGATESPSYSGSGAESPTTYTQKWWTGLLTSLHPNIFSDPAQTDAFMKQHLPLDQVNQSVPAPPVSPTAGQNSPDMNFTNAFGSRGPASNVSTPIQMSASSPAPITELPLRPQPRKLQTPQSTPRSSDNTPWLGAALNTQKQLRSSASVDALRYCMRKQVLSASLDRCPPPQPQHQASRNALHHNLARPAEPSQPHAFSSCPSPPPTPEASSTAWSFAYVANRAYRSRSSSISSNSSCSSRMSSQQDRLQSKPYPSATSQSRLFGSEPSSSPSSSQGEAQRTLWRKSSFIISPPSSVDDGSEGYVNAEEASEGSVTQSAGHVDADAMAASALMDLRVGDRQSLTPQPRPCTQSQDSTPKAKLQCFQSRGHKRTISKTNDNLHDNIRGLLQDGGPAWNLLDDTAEDSSAVDTSAQKDKQTQQPHRKWAQLKRPVSNAQLNKRMALDCSSQQRTLSVPELTQAYLRPDIGPRYVGWNEGM